MDRRTFLLDTCRACAAIAAVPVIASLEGCGGAKALAIEPAPGTKVLAVPVGQFGNANYAVVRTKQVGDPLIIVKQRDGNYKALVKRCTHKGGPINMEGDNLHCSWHGSRFALDGTVTEGPASKPLATFPASLEGDVVKVDLGA